MTTRRFDTFRVVQQITSKELVGLVELPTFVEVINKALMSKRYFEQLLSRKDQGKTFRFSFVGGGSCMHSTNQRLSKKLRLHQWQPPSQKNPNAPSRLFSYAITVGKLMTFLLIVWWDNECVLSINSLVTCRKIAQDGCNNDLTHLVISGGVDLIGTKPKSLL